MKQFLSMRHWQIGLALLASALATGCPMYSENGSSVECIYATDCLDGYRCTSAGFCVPAPPHNTVKDGGTTDVKSDAVDNDALADVTSDRSGDDALADTRSDRAVDGPVSGDAAPPLYCGNPNDCTAEQTCSTDGTCHAGNCSATPCINQYQCAVTTSGPACVRGDSRGCSADRQCLANERCLDGQCASAAELCSDRAQCGTGKACVDGRCVTACTTDGQCAAGYLCRTALGVCSAKAKTCAHTVDCASKDEVCVDAACVPRCAAAGVCGGGSGVCVDNGCVPTSKVAAECDGQGTTTGCPAGNICLHHHCYASCAADAGGCNAQSTAPVCKTVNVAGASYSVCGATDSLGAECDLSADKACTAGKTCVDGFCR